MKNQNNSSAGKYTGLVCGHCGESGHSKQRCYEIIGYPEWWDFSKKPRKKFAGKAMMTTAEAQTTAADKLPAADNLLCNYILANTCAALVRQIHSLQLLRIIIG
jgi:hypothetical protein